MLPQGLQMGSHHMSRTCTRIHTHTHTHTHACTQLISGLSKAGLDTVFALVGKLISMLAPFSAQDSDVQASIRSRLHDNQTALGFVEADGRGKVTELGAPRKEANVSG